MMSTHKKYIPEFLHNRPKWIVDFIMEKWELVDAEDTDNELIICKKTETSYEISSLTSRNVSYEVNCSDVATCSCQALVRSRFICKHIILMLKKFPDFNIGTLVLKNEVYRIDEDVVNLHVNSATSIQNEPAVEDISHDCPTQQEFAKLDSRKSKKAKLIAECNSMIRSLQSAMWLLGEQHLEKLKNDLQHLYKDTTVHVTMDSDTSLPLAAPTSSSIKRKACQYAELPKPIKK